MKKKSIALLSFLMMITLFHSAHFTFAQNGAEEDVEYLSTEIENKKANVDNLNRKIDQYKKEIAGKQKEGVSLRNELELLDNRVAKSQLDIEQTQQQMEIVNAELRLLEMEQEKLEAQLARDRELLKKVVQKMDTYDRSLRLELLFGSRTFADVFSRVQDLDSVRGELGKTLNRAKDAKTKVTAATLMQQTKRERLSQLFLTINRQKEQWEQETQSKSVLLSQAQNSEVQFQKLLRELREEQAFINNQVLDLQLKLGEKLGESDAVGGSTLSWPVDKGYKGISTLFHDPEYPFRHLFEHSGLDIPQPQGTPLKAAAPGYVAWTRTGRLYGNYIMIIHSGGVATLYAHLSRIDVKPDQFVSRGQTIGATGGMPGTKGAGLSTGPHLHFETRKDGVPVDPMRYLFP